jgi:hypothetical protein
MVLLRFAVLVMLRSAKLIALWLAGGGVVRWLIIRCRPKGAGLTVSM